MLLNVEKLKAQAERAIIECTIFAERGRQRQIEDLIDDNRLFRKWFVFCRIWVKKLDKESAGAIVDRSIYYGYRLIKGEETLRKWETPEIREKRQAAEEYILLCNVAVVDELGESEICSLDLVKIA